MAFYSSFSYSFLDCLAMPNHSAPFMFSKSLLIKRQQKRLLFFRRSDRTRRAAQISGRLRDAAGVRRAGKPHSGRRAKRVPRKVCPPTKLRPSALACRRASHARRPTLSEGLSTAQGISAARNVFARRACSLPKA